MISDELRLDKLRRRQLGPPPSHSTTAVLQQFCRSFAAVCGALAVYLRSRQDECFSAPVFHRLPSATLGGPRAVPRRGERRCAFWSWRRLRAAGEATGRLGSESESRRVCDGFGERCRKNGGTLGWVATALLAPSERARQWAGEVKTRDKGPRNERRRELLLSASPVNWCVERFASAGQAPRTIRSQTISLREILKEDMTNLPFWEAVSLAERR
jgi:hypothetical protein